MFRRPLPVPARPCLEANVTATLQILILLLVVIAAVGVAARRLDVPPSILLVLTGVALALVPGLPAVRLAPPLVLLMVLPPQSCPRRPWR